jgi:hypothetical protein
VMTAKRSIKRSQLEAQCASAIPCYGDFLSATEDAEDYQNFRRVQVLALEPRSILELQIALTITDIGWEIHRHTTALDQLEREQKLVGLLDEGPTAASSASMQWKQVEVPAVLSVDGRDRTTVPYSAFTNPCGVTIYASAEYHEARISELERCVENLSNRMRELRKKSKSFALVLSNRKLH